MRYYEAVKQAADCRYMCRLVAEGKNLANPVKIGLTVMEKLLGYWRMRWEKSGASRNRFRD